MRGEERGEKDRYLKKKNTYRQDTLTQTENNKEIIAYLKVSNSPCQYMPVQTARITVYFSGLK